MRSLFNVADSSEGMFAALGSGLDQHQKAMTAASATAEA